MWVSAASCWKKNKDSLFSASKFSKTCGRICSVQLSKFTVKKENGYDYSWYTASTSYAAFNVTHQHLVYLCGQRSKTMLHLQKTLALDWLHHYTLPLKSILATQSASGSSCTTINLYGFKAILWLHVQMTWIHWFLGTTIWRFLWRCFYLHSKLSDVSSERPCCAQSHTIFNKTLDDCSLFSSQHTVDFDRNKTLEN